MVGKVKSVDRNELSEIPETETAATAPVAAMDTEAPIPMFPPAAPSDPEPRTMVSGDGADEVPP